MEFLYDSGLQVGKVSQTDEYLLGKPVEEPQKAENDVSKVPNFLAGKDLPLWRTFLTEEYSDTLKTLVMNCRCMGKPRFLKENNFTK